MRWRAVVDLVLLAGTCGLAAQAAVNLDGKVSDPFSLPARVRVFIFTRTDCPLTNKYAPELRRLAEEFVAQDVRFWLVYSSSGAESLSGIKQQITDYQLPGEPLRDTNQLLAMKSRATVAPEAAVFDKKGQLVYHGRIDDRWVGPGTSRPAALTHDLEIAIADTLAGRKIQHAETHAIGCSLADLQ